MENIIVEIDRKVAISFSKNFKDKCFVDGGNNVVETNMKTIKKDITEYISNNKEKFDANLLTSFVYDYDLGIGVTVMKPQKEYDVYIIVSFFSLSVPEETMEDDEEKEETKQIAKLLKDREGEI